MININYFRAVEGEITRKLMKFEAQTLLPIAQQAVEDVGAKVDRSIPVTGRFAMGKDDLKEYFFLLQALRHPENFTKADPHAVTMLQRVYSEPMFGVRQVVRNEYNDNVLDPWADPSVLSPVRDPLHEAVFDSGELGVDKIMNSFDEQFLGSGLITFAYVTDKANMKDGKWNPVATALVAASDMDYQLKPVVVTDGDKLNGDVRAAGEKAIRAYNGLFGKFDRSDLFMTCPKNEGDLNALLEKAQTPYRVVRVAADEDRVFGHYHWAVVDDGGLKVIDFKASNHVSTRDYQRDGVKAFSRFAYDKVGHLL